MENFVGYKEKSFEGFKPVRELRKNRDVIPRQKGVYMVLYPQETDPVFLEKGTGGFFKGDDPNVSISTLEENWIEGEQVLYIGKAGGKGRKANLQSRIQQFMEFGCGKDVGHKGGRYIWQFKDAEDLIVCWKILVDEEPREVEKRMIQKFKRDHEGRRPFANLQD